MTLNNRTFTLLKIVLLIIISIFIAEIIVLPKIEHDMLQEAGRQELVTVQQICGAVLENYPDVEQDFILGLRQPTNSLQEKGEQILKQYGYTIYGLLIVIGIIGYISLINTMITSILVRKKELGILQAIGLSDKQLRQMIHREGLFFTFGTLALSLTIGNGLGYLLVRIIINTQILTISQYEYPITQTLVLIVAVVIGQIAITVFVNRYIHKQSLVERMRD